MSGHLSDWTEAGFKAGTSMGLLARIISSPREGLARAKTPQSYQISSSPTSPVGSTGSPSFRTNLPPALQTKRDEVASNSGLGGMWAVVGNLVRLCDESETCALKSTVKTAMDVGQRCVRLQVIRSLLASIFPAETLESFLSSALEVQCKVVWKLLRESYNTLKTRSEIRLVKHFENTGYSGPALKLKPDPMV